MVDGGIMLKMAEIAANNPFNGETGWVEDGRVGVAGAILLLGGEQLKAQR